MTCAECLGYFLVPEACIPSCLQLLNTSCQQIEGTSQLRAVKLVQLVTKGLTNSQQLTPHVPSLVNALLDMVQAIAMDVQLQDDTLELLDQFLAHCDDTDASSQRQCNDSKQRIEISDEALPNDYRLHNGCITSGEEMHSLDCADAMEDSSIKTPCPRVKDSSDSNSRIFDTSDSGIDRTSDSASSCEDRISDSREGSRSTNSRTSTNNDIGPYQLDSLTTVPSMYTADHGANSADPDMNKTDKSMQTSVMRLLLLVAGSEVCPHTSARAVHIISSRMCSQRHGEQW